MEDQRTFWGWGFVVSLLCFSVTAFTLILGGADEIRLYLSGETTPGVVTEMRRYQRPKGGYDYFLKYTYKANNEDRAGRSEVRESDYMSLPKGSSIRVAYLPSRPAVSSFQDVLPSNFFSLSLVVGASGFFGAIFLFLAIRGVKPTNTNA